MERDQCGSLYFTLGGWERPFLIPKVLTEQRSIVREGAMHCWGREEQDVQRLLFALFKEQHGHLFS